MYNIENLKQILTSHEQMEPVRANLSFSHKIMFDTLINDNYHDLKLTQVGRYYKTMMNLSQKVFITSNYPQVDNLKF